MARYLVKHKYRSSAYGPWVAGDHVELDPGQAAWVNHDSPGTLEEVDPQKQAEEKRREVAARELHASSPQPRRRSPRKTSGA